LKDLLFLAKALEYHCRALAIQERVLGDHPAIASTLNNIGVVHEKRSELGKALAPSGATPSRSVRLLL